MKASEAMAECLKKEQISVVFGYPGAAICPFYDALCGTEIRHILVRHEANAGHAANGYARMTGKPAVCIATSGPGAANLLTAIATAYADSIPLIAITGQVNCDQIGSDAFQEADITGSAEPFVKHSYLVKDAKQIPHIFKEAFYIAGTGRPGPVLIDVPMDVQTEEIEFNYPETIDIRSYRPTAKGNYVQIKKVLKKLEEAEKPLICIGGGVFAAGAQAQVRALAEKMQIPVISTMMGLSVFESDNPLFFGMLGMHGVKPANTAVNECDVLFLVGARVGDRAVRTPLKLEKHTTIIHIDVDPAEIGKNIRADIPLVGDARLVLEQLLEMAPDRTHSAWLERLSSLKSEPVFAPAALGTVNPRKFLHRLSQEAAPETTLVADVGQSQIWAANFYQIRKGRFLTAGGMGTMGYSVPAAIGARLADQTKPVIAVCGDGAFQMCLMELATAVQHDVDLKIIVMANNWLGMVREVQARQYGKRFIGVNLDGSPDFIALAKAYGFEALRVTNEQEADLAIQKLTEPKGRLLVECIVAPDEATM